MFNILYRNGLEGILDVGYLGSSTADEDADHVEAQGLEFGGSLGQVLLGHEADGLLLAGGYGLQGGAVGGSAAELHLDEDEDVGSQVKSNPLAPRLPLHPRWGRG